MVLPLGVEIVKGNPSAAIDASLLKGVTGAIAVTSVTVVAGVLTVGFLDETNMPQTATLTAVAGASDAASISVVVTSYGKNLETTDLNVQLALQRLSALILGDVHIAVSYAQPSSPRCGIRGPDLVREVDQEALRMRRLHDLWGPAVGRVRGCGLLHLHCL